ncbi:MAG: hypothetical protein WCS20_08945 [Alphaproteobacteria bacterium]
MSGKVGEQTLLDTDGNVSTLVNGPVVFQAQGAASDVMLPFVQSIDFAKIGTFDTK